MFTHEALRNSYELVETSPCVGSSLEVLEERGKPEYLEKNLSEQGRESTTNSTHIWRQLRDLNQGQIGGRASALTTVPSLILLPKHIFLILGVSTETFSTKGNLASTQKRKKNEESWTFKSANKLVLGTWHTWLNLYFSLIQSLALKQWHKTRWNDDKWHNNELGLNPLATWPTPQNAEWLYLKFRLGDTYHPPPFP